MELEDPAAAESQSSGEDDNNNSASEAATKPTRNNSRGSRRGRRKRVSRDLDKNFMPKDMEQPKVFQICTELYKLSEHCAEFSRLYQEAHPQLMSSKCKYYVSTEQNGVGCLDLLFSSFCHFFGMEKVINLTSDAGERVFCWLGKRRANEILPVLRPNHHFVNRLPSDIYLKDKQSLACALKANMFQNGISYPAHNCSHSMGRRIHFQLLCPHQYARHSFQRCLEPGCFEMQQQVACRERGVDQLHFGDFCPCFVAGYFVPETKVFSSLVQQSIFIEDIAQLAPDSQWIVKPSYMRSGKGIRVLSSVQQLREFLKVKSSHRFMWGQNYIVQRYIKKPMLTNSGQKFDLRMFLLVIVGRFWRVLGFLHPGYIRKVASPYRQMQRGDKFKASVHLANTRIWKRAGADTGKSMAHQSRSSSLITTLDNSMSGVPIGGRQRNNAARTRTRAKVPRSKTTTEELSEPVPLTGLFLNSFDRDECEEYNYAVRHGCLKGNNNNLPLLLGSFPGLNFGCRTGAGTEGTWTAGTGAAGTGTAGTGATGTGAAGTGAAGTGTAGTGAAGTGTAGTGAAGTGAACTGAAGTGAAGTGAAGTGAAGTGAACTGAAGTETAAIETSGTETAGKDTSGTGTASKGTASKGTASKDTAGTGTASGGASSRSRSEGFPRDRNSDPLGQFASNEKFVQSLRVMVNQICLSIFDQVKDRGNCHQLFSLDICIDESGKPWLLEINPSIITEDVNWESLTIRNVIPAVLIESLSLALECTKKSLHFLALRTPKTYTRKPCDLMFRQNFLWMYNTPAKRCQMFELKNLKYSFDRMYRAKLVAKGVVYDPVDYYPNRNNRDTASSTRMSRQTRKSAEVNRNTYRFPTPVASLPVLEEDVTYSMRYVKIQPDCITRQRRVRRMQQDTDKRQVQNELLRYRVYLENKKQSVFNKFQRLRVE